MTRPRLPGLILLLGLLGGFYAHRHQYARDVIANPALHQRKQLECLALIFLLGIFLCIPAQVNPLAKVVKHRQMLAPMLIDHL